MYSVEFSPGAHKKFLKLPKLEQERIGAVIDRVRIRPHAHCKRLVGSPYYSARAGKYRTIVDIKGQVLLIYVIEISHRKNVYK